MRRTGLHIAAAGMVALAAILVLPEALELFALINATVFVSMAVLALSLGLVWGFGGILCFGQTTFFGLGAYTYAVAAINFGDTTWAVPLALAVPALAAAALGYLMFFGRISDVYMGVITLTVTLILFAFANSTAGDQWTIGSAALGGFNGMPGTPPLNLPLQPDVPLTPAQVFVVAVLCLLACYAAAKLLLRTRFGRVAVAIRENELRAELLGYDVRLHKLALFAVGGLMAGLAGILFANCVFVSPTMFSLSYAGQVIIWVLVGGLGTLVGPIVGCILVQALATYAGTLPGLDPNLVLGVVFMLAVLGVPKGLLPTGAGWLERLAPAPPASRVMTALLATEALTMRFGGVLAVDGVSLSVAEGELRCLIGPNGAGKSTLFKCLTGQLRPTSGRIFLRGEDVTGRDSFAIARRGVGIKTQVPSLFDGLDVRECVILALRRRHGERHARIQAAATLERLGIAHLAERRVGLLAHGQRQLVELAMVVAPEPDLIILDEPTAGMSAEETQAAVAVIRDLHRRHAIVVVEHDMQFIRAIAARVTVFHQGRVLIEDDAAAVFADPRVRDVYLGRAATPDRAASGIAA